jgi:1-acyl-sn-glycerol-3-phosphate acyltransferase
MVYRFLRVLARWLLGIFYRRIDAIGLDHVPLHGPLLIVANHHNALVDALLLLSTVPRHLVPVAKAPLFGHPVLGPLLRLVRALPAHRQQDNSEEARADLRRNAALFAAATATLRRDRAILIFPEGVSHAEPTVVALRTGAARIVLGAEAQSDGALGVTVLPVGLVYHDPGTFRTGRALVQIGPPVPITDLVARYEAGPEAAVRALTDRLAAALRALIIEADDRHTYQLLRTAEVIWREEAGGARPDAVEQTDWMRRVLRGRAYLAEREPHRLEAFRRALEGYARDLERARLPAGLGARAYSGRGVLEYTFVQGLTLLFELPVALWGIVLHVVPYRLTALAVRWLRPEDDMVATVKLSAGALLFPLCWLAEGWVAWRIGGPGFLGFVLATLMPAGFFALSWQARLERVRRNARGFLHYLVHRDVHRHLADRRTALAQELTALGRLVPDAVLRAHPRQ